MMTHDSFANAYRKGLCSTIRLLVSKGILADEAEELAQSAWVRGWEARKQLKDSTRIVSWVNSIAMNTMCNLKRRWGRQLELNERRAHEPLAIAAKIDAAKLLTKCSTLDRSLILCRYAGGFEMEEVAQIHGMSCVAARVRIHRAKAALRRYAEESRLPLLRRNIERRAGVSLSYLA